MSNYVKAIRKIRPNSEFVINGDNLDNIDWHVIDGEIPTKEEILAEVATVEQEEADALAQVVATKASAIAKLAKLGLTEEEAKAIIG